MNDNLYIRILEELNKSGIGIERNISYIFNTDDNIVEETLENVVLNNRTGAIEKLLKDMSKMENISLGYCKPKENGDGKRRLIQQVEVYATLTVKGFAELNSFKNSEKQNSFVSFQRVVLALTFILSATTFYNGCTNEKTLEDLKSRLNIIENHTDRPELKAK